MYTVQVQVQCYFSLVHCQAKQGQEKLSYRYIIPLKTDKLVRPEISTQSIIISMTLSRSFGFCLKSVAYLVCIVGFLTLSGEQIKQYLKGQTSISKSFRHSPSLKASNFTFQIVEYMYVV